MPAPRARQITLTAAERRRLKALAYSHTAGYQQVIRARIVRDAAYGHSNATIRSPALDCPALRPGKPRLRRWTVV